MNPYENMAKRAFWRSGVVEDNKLDNIHTPKWEIGTKECIVTMGSCFAQHVGKKLKSSGFNVPYFDYEDGVKTKAYSANYGNIYTVRQALQLLKESNGNFSRNESFWVTDSGYVDPIRPNVFTKPFESKNELNLNRKNHLDAVRRAINELDVLVFTMGLTEAWENISCKSILPVVPGVLGGTFNQENYAFRNFSFTEISNDFNEFIREIHNIRKGRSFKLLLTVSPVPLTATAESRHVLVSTVASKSILRAIADDYTRKFDFVDYFPSFEIITNPKFIGDNYEENMRNVKQSAVDNVMDIFHKSYVKKNLSDDFKKSTNKSEMIDEIGDVDCEEALLDQFANTEQSFSEEKDILFFGNSHLGFMMNALSSTTTNRSIFVPVNFLKNDPIGDIQYDGFQKFYFKVADFENIVGHQCKTLVVVAYGIFGDGIFRALGPLKTGFQGCIGSKISPQISCTSFDEVAVRKLFYHQLKVRLDHLRKISETNLFEHIACIVSPDLPEKTARFRFGDEFVNSKLFLSYKRVYTEVFYDLAESLQSKIKFIFHENENLYSDTGFVKDKYSGQLLWNIHPFRQFYIDSNVENKIFDITNQHDKSVSSAITAQSGELS